MTPLPPSQHDPDSEFYDSEETGDSPLAGAPDPGAPPPTSAESDPVAGEDELDDEPPEFSLRQLSEAYAQVIELQTGQRPQLDGDEAGEDTGEDELEAEEEPESDDVSCPITPESIVESILFVGAPQGESLTSRKIASVLRDVSPAEVTRICKSLNQQYERENAAYRIESKGGKLQMILDPALQDFQHDYFGRNRRARLSQAAIDIMAIVAYNQPITREQIDQVRGRPCGSVLTQLVRREILQVQPGTEDPRVRYYSTTDRFLDLFQLDDIRDLPQSHDVTDIAELAD